jgi:replicative DNA helicase
MTLNGLAQGIKPLRELLGDTKTELLERGGKPKYPLNTLPALSQKIWGLHKGLTVIGARSTMCKSALALQIARDFITQQIPTLFLSLEMDVPSMIERLYCSMMEVDNFDVLCGRLNIDPIMQNKWQDFEEKIKEMPLLLTNGIGKNFYELNQLIALLDPKPRCVIVDYIQGIRQSEKERTEIGEYIRNFRQLMIENKMVGILVSQMNRQIIDNVDKKPTLENLKSTGVLEEHADMVLMLYWGWFYNRKDENKNKYEIIVGKNRNGRTGSHDLLYIPEYYLFREVEQVVAENSNVRSALATFEGSLVK